MKRMIAVSLVAVVAGTIGGSLLAAGGDSSEPSQPADSLRVVEPAQEQDTFSLLGNAVQIMSRDSGSIVRVEAASITGGVLRGTVAEVLHTSADDPLGAGSTVELNVPADQGDTPPWSGILLISSERLLGAAALDTGGQLRRVDRLSEELNYLADGVRVLRAGGPEVYLPNEICTGETVEEPTSDIGALTYYVQRLALRRHQLLESGAYASVEEQLAVDRKSTEYSDSADPITGELSPISRLDVLDEVRGTRIEEVRYSVPVLVRGWPEDVGHTPQRIVFRGRESGRLLSWVALFPSGPSGSPMGEPLEASVFIDPPMSGESVSIALEADSGGIPGACGGGDELGTFTYDEVFGSERIMIDVASGRVNGRDATE